MNEKAYCVYTAVLGGYEEINAQPVAHESKIEFLCFTDDAKAKSETWKIIRVDPVFPYDSIRSARTIKIAAHRYLPPEYSSSLYIDNSIKLKTIPAKIFRDFSLDDNDLYLRKHSFREKVLDEYEEVLRVNYDNFNLIIEQLNVYSMIDPGLFNDKPIATGFILRNHNKRDVISMMEDWLAQVIRYSRRDQLSIYYVIRKQKIKINLLDLDSHSTAYYEWPTAQRFGRPAIEPSLSYSIEHNLQVDALKRKLEIINAALAEHEQTIQQLKQEVVFYANSKSWKITSPLREWTQLLKHIFNLNE